MNVQRKKQKQLIFGYYEFTIILNFEAKLQKKGCHRLKILEAEKMPHWRKVDD